MLMAILWIIHTIIVLCFYRDLPALSILSASENNDSIYGATNNRSVDVEQVEVKVVQQNNDSSSFWRSFSGG